MSDDVDVLSPNVVSEVQGHKLRIPEVVCANGNCQQIIQNSAKPGVKV